MKTLLELSLEKALTGKPLTSVQARKVSSAGGPEMEARKVLAALLVLSLCALAQGELAIALDPKAKTLAF